MKKPFEMNDDYEIHSQLFPIYSGELQKAYTAALFNPFTALISGIRLRAVTFTKIR